VSPDASDVSGRRYGLPDLKGLVALYLPVLALLFVVVIAARYSHTSVSSLTRDMAAIAHVHPLIGVVSNVGILLWCATAAICLFGRSLLRERGLPAEASFLLWAGLLTAVLLVDDLFMIHEYIAPVHFHVNEKVVLAAHACMAGAYLLSHRRLILASNYQLLAAAMALFAASILVDITDAHGWWSLAEDGFKVLGIASWFGYHAGRARHWLVHAPPVPSRRMAAPESSPPALHPEDEGRQATTLN
jgi:hypothetical protein